MLLCLFARLHAATTSHLLLPPAPRTGGGATAHHERNGQCTNRTLGQNNFTEQPAEKGRIRRLIERHRRAMFRRYQTSFLKLANFLCALWRAGSGAVAARRKPLITLTRTDMNLDIFRPFKKRTLITTYTSLSSDQRFPT